MKKIYFFIQHYPDWTTGGLKYHSIVFDYAVSKGYNVEVFGNSRIESKYYKIKILRLFYGLFNTFRIPSGSIIFMSNASFLDYYLPIKLNKLLKRHKYFFLIHHLVQTEKPKSKSRRYFESEFVKSADGVATISNVTNKQLIELNLIKKDISIIPPGLDVNFKTVPSVKILPKKHKLLFVGTIEKRKGLLDVIMALKNLKNYDFELTVIGAIKEPAYYDKIILELNKNKISDRVKFPGKVIQAELVSNYLNSSIFVFPSYWEGYGMVIAEALGYGLPVAASDIPATNEIIEDGIEGVLFKLSDVDDITDKLKYLFDNPDKIKAMSANAVLKAKTFPTWEETSKKVLNELHKM
jgi:glycosyltransferase involved in cell wall biosynthesis